MLILHLKLIGSLLDVIPTEKLLRVLLQMRRPLILMMVMVLQSGQPRSFLKRILLLLVEHQDLILLLDDNIDEGLGGATALIAYQKVQVMVLEVRQYWHLCGSRVITCFHFFRFGPMWDYLFTQLTIVGTDCAVAVFIDLLLRKAFV